MRDLRDERRAALDGASALVMGIVVVGLMSAAGPALKATPGLFAGWLVLAFTINLALQVGTYWLAPHRKDGRDRTATSIVAGNRNIALFLIALPEATMGTLLLFIGCWQFPMYLTPILMRRLIA